MRTILTIIVGMLALSVQAQEIYTGAIAISPSVPTNSWPPASMQPKPTLAPGDSAKLSITVAQSGSYNGRNYTLHGNPIQHPPISSPPGSIIWRGTYSSLHACNAGNSPGTTTATVTAEWVETGSGGGGSGGSPSIISGEATGIAQADIPVFSWSFDQRMQFADGTSPITYTVTGSITGRRVSMTSYTIKALVPEWTVTPDPLSSTNIRTGKITSINSAKSKMGVYYGERELARSTNEIAFAKVDLIVCHGPGTNGGTPLPEDRLTNGGAAPATNELNPGTFVLLLPQDQTNRVATTLTLKADPTGGSLNLAKNGLDDLKIYTDEALQQELPIPKTWADGETSPTTLYMVGSSSSTNLESASGTLDLTYKATLGADGIEQSIKDTVGVTLLPVQIDFETVEGNTPIEDNKKPAVNAQGAFIADQWMPGKGKKIFPDKISPTDTTERNTVYVKVTGVPQGWKVRLKVFDVDDQTPDSLDPQHVIDENDDASAKRGNDNRGYDGLGMQQPPYFESSGDVTLDCTVDATGVAKLAGGQMPKIVLTMQPGDNLRVAAILLKPDGNPFDGQSLDDLQVNDSRLDGYVPGDSDQFASGFTGALSPTLTVWRRLWLEFDSMGPAPTTGEEKNFDEGVIDTYTDNGNGTSTVNLSIGLTDEADRYEEGKIEINGAGTFTVVSNTDNLVSDDDVVIQGTPGSTVVGKSFKIYDDDYVAIGSRAPHTMPYALSGGTLMQTAYADAYIKPVDVPSQYIDTNIAFDRNLTETEALLKMAAGSAGKDLSDAPNFWVVHLLASWQGGTGDDLDPSIGNAQSLLGLGSDPFNSGFIFVETIREGESLPSTPRTTEEHTVVHEVGHQGGAPHDDGGIMAPGAPINENKFKPVTIKRFRDESSF